VRRSVRGVALVRPSLGGLFSPLRATHPRGASASDSTRFPQTGTGIVEDDNVRVGRNNSSWTARHRQIASITIRRRRARSIALAGGGRHLGDPRRIAGDDPPRQPLQRKRSFPPVDWFAFGFRSAILGDARVCDIARPYGVKAHQQLTTCADWRVLAGSRWSRTTRRICVDRAERSSGVRQDEGPSRLRLARFRSAWMRACRRCGSRRS
jgi:hypothetical protein